MFGDLVFLVLRLHQGGLVFLILPTPASFTSLCRMPKCEQHRWQQQIMLKWAYFTTYNRNKHPEPEKSYQSLCICQIGETNSIAETWTKKPENFKGSLLTHIPFMIKKWASQLQTSAPILASLFSAKKINALKSFFFSAEGIVDGSKDMHIFLWIGVIWYVKLSTP